MENLIRVKLREIPQVTMFLCLFSILIFSSCTRKYNSIEFSSSLDNSFFHSELLNRYFKKSNGGCILKDSNIIHCDKNLAFKDTLWQLIDVSFGRDTIFLSFSISYAHIKYIIVNGKFFNEIFYSTDLMNTYPEGEVFGTYIEPKIIYHKLIIKNRKFNCGDTIYGYFKLKTEPFKYVKNKKSDLFSGYFVTIIRKNIPKNGSK